MGQITDMTSNIGGAVSDLFGASGSAASARSYEQAAAIAGQNSQLTKQATAIQEAQQSRQLYKTLGTQQAQVSGAGLSASGSALDLYRSSASQGALTKALTAEQGAIQENAYAEQQGLYLGMASAAQSTSTAQTIGGVVMAGSAAVNGAEALTGTSTIGGALSAFGAGGGGAVAADVGAGAVTDIAGYAAVDAAATEAGGFAFGDLIMAAIAWVVCTELHRQGRMPSKWYYMGFKRFKEYDERTKQGYYWWAIPAVRHLRAHPNDWLSNLLDWAINHRAEYIAAQYGVRGARKTVAGWVMLAGLYGACWVFSRTVARHPTDWSVLYNTGA